MNLIERKKIIENYNKIIGLYKKRLEFQSSHYVEQGQGVLWMDVFYNNKTDIFFYTF